MSPARDGYGRTLVPVDRDGRPVAAMVIDGTLAEDPELLRAAASVTALAVENGNLVPRQTTLARSTIFCRQRS